MHIPEGHCDREWFWDADWQAREVEADAETNAGRIVYASSDEFMTMLTEGEPRFKTDCTDCEYMGRMGPFDVYHCEHSLVSGIVWRFGEGPDYTTMPEALPALYSFIERANEMARQRDERANV
jgi:hypothetical protein